MEIINIENYTEERFHTAIALGNFDGLHLGHRELILTMNEEAIESQLKKSVLLFNNHTKKIISRKSPKLLTTLDEKEEIFESLEVDIIYKVDFNNYLMNLCPEKFVYEILIQKLNVKLVIVGFDYKFGKNARGDIVLLKKLSKKYGFKLKVVAPVYWGESIISSSEIRKLINIGDVKTANLMLGENYKIKGKVVDGNKEGRKLGFPTANLFAPEEKVIPKEGIYITNTIINGVKFKSATSIGKNPTFEEKETKIETHIIDYKGDLYGEIIQLEFIEYIRSQIKYENLDDLKLRIKKDIEIVCNKFLSFRKMHFK